MDRPRLLLGLDVRTDTRTPAEARITEVGLVLWDAADDRPVRMAGMVIHHATRPDGTAPLTSAHGVTPIAAAQTAKRWWDWADMVIGHHVLPHTREVVEREWGVPERPWVDTAKVLPGYTRVPRIAYVAADHAFLLQRPNVPLLNALATLQILAQYDLPTLLRRTDTAAVRVVAEIDFAQNAEAKSRGFRWNPRRKQWAKEIPRTELDTLAAGAPFPLVVEYPDGTSKRFAPRASQNAPRESTLSPPPGADEHAPEAPPGPDDAAPFPDDIEAPPDLFD